MATFRTSFFNKLLLFALTFSALTFGACDPDENSLGDFDFGPTDEEIVAGLKAALQVGTDSSVTTLNATDGYFKDPLVKIFLPPEADVIFDNLSTLGLQPLADVTIERVNRAAEDAATEATPIFVDAITNMTISDGKNILFGDSVAATTFLRDNTYEQLVTAFQPKIQTSLEKSIVLGISADDSYNTLVNSYNTFAQIPFSGLDPVKETSLSAYTTRKGLDGLFLKVADEERLIREDPIHRVLDILEKVFSQLD